MFLKPKSMSTRKPEKKMKMEKCVPLLVLLIFLSYVADGELNKVNMGAVEENRFGKKPLISIGAVVDYNSRAGQEEKVAMEMAIQEFYAFANASELSHLLVKDSGGDPLRAASAAGKLIKKHGVAAIVGLKIWEEASIVAELGNKSQVPILSLANEVPFWAPSHWPFLVNSARSQFAQMKAVAAIVSSWQWRKVNVIYEDIGSAVSGVIPYLTSALQDEGSEISELLPVPPLHSEHYSLPEKLKHLMNGQCRVFIIHTSAALGTNVLMEAKKLGMMKKEFVWITTAAIANLIDTFNASVISSMQGVLGVRSYFPQSKLIKDFRSRFRSKFRLSFGYEAYSEPSIYALEAYDAMWAVALATGRVPAHPYSTDHRVSISGKKLLIRILRGNFEGLNGAFKFSNGKLAPQHIFCIVNVVDKSYRELGYWTEKLGFSESISVGMNKYNKSMRSLEQVFWPGGTSLVPRGWALPTDAKPLIIGVPTANTHRDFIEVEKDLGGKVHATGFAIDVFNSAIKLLPYHKLPHSFVEFNGSYDEMVQQIKLKMYDAVVADTAIVSSRCEYAEFSQPYADSGLQIVIYARPKRLNRAWLFTKPFTESMWITTVLTNFYSGFAVWFIEWKHNPQLRRDTTKWKQIGTMLSSSFITLFSLKGDGLHTNLARMVMVVWLFLALVITQSFTASLASLLTIQGFGTPTDDADSLRQSGAKVGCDGTSFVVEYLHSALHFPRNNIISMYSEDNYTQALRNGDIAAAFLEVPYVKVFLAKHCKEFITSGPTYKVGGFGFVFPKDSAYLPDISEAIVKMTEKGTLDTLKDSLTSSYKCSYSESNPDHERLEFTSFKGLFVIAWITTTIALLLFFVPPYIGLDQPFNDRQQQQQQQQQHDPQMDENILFAAEMENQQRRP